MNTADEGKSQINFVDFFVLCKALIIGLVFGDLWYFGYEVGKSIYRNFDPDFGSIEFTLFGVTTLLCLYVVFWYARQRQFASSFSRVLVSKRWDLFVILVLGIFISYSFGGISVKYYVDVLKRFSACQLIIFTLLPIIFSLVLTIKSFCQVRKVKQTYSSIFINDNEIEGLEGDLLGVKESAVRFAEYIWNKGSDDSLVFGLDAPWGAGKSSFINICLKHLEQKDKERVCVIYHFNLLRYQDRSNLLEKLLDGLVSEIQSKFFIPELDSLFKNYAKVVHGKVSFSLPGLRFDPNRNLDHAFEQLETAIKKLDAKIIIVIDDLDRLSISEIKEILFSIKKSFMLKNVSYLLSYDTQNIVKQDGRSETAESLREFLEKFINIKYSLFLDSKTLSKYINEFFENAVSKSLLTDQAVVKQAKIFFSVLNEIYEADDYHRYQCYLGDIRKVKRLINLVLILEVEKTDFENSDVDKKDLVHLLLIYLNYPHIFRKIFDSESNGRSELFSLKRFKEKDQEASWKNSDEFNEYISELPSDQRFLLNKIFSVEVLSSKQSPFEKIESENHKSACFNRYSKNLERHLKLLVSLNKPKLEDQIQFYLNLKDKFMSVSNLEELFQENTIKSVHSEKTRGELLNAIFNNAREMSKAKASEIIEYICTHSSHYCLLSLSGLDLGYRNNLVIGLARVLDNAGWTDKADGHVNNDDENVAEIACRVFGEGEYWGCGVLKLLSNSGKFELAINEILEFRLYLCSNRHNGFYNLQRAIYLHSSPEGKHSGNTDDLTRDGVRLLSQKVFEIFKDTYITKKINFFAKVNELQPDSLVGNYFEYLQSCIRNGLYQQAELDKQITLKKNEIKVFVSYQLTNTYLSNGIGCGYYDEMGSADQKGISAAMNDYFFDVCFAENFSNEGYKCFVDYLMLSWPRALHENEYGGLPPKLDDFTVILERKKLTEYWNKNRDSIKELGFENLDRNVVTWNHTINYKDKLKIIFDLLDKQS